VSADGAFVPRSRFEEVAATGDLPERLGLIADMCRLNALTSIVLAGSGHPGSTLSSLDVVVYLHYAEMRRSGPDPDVYFSSKGHDVPGLYAVLHSLGVLEEGELARLRRIDGPCGHPHVATPGMVANTGSLGMGLSKARGLALARRLGGREGRVFVMLGDGELQEGQVYEALRTAALDRLGNLTAIVDRNEVQSDRLVSETSDLGDFEGCARALGWHVTSCDGHDFADLERALTWRRAVRDAPALVVARTIKGRGVSFMEHPTALRAAGGTYPFHAGAPGPERYAAAAAELRASIDERLARRGLRPVQVPPPPPPASPPPAGVDLVAAHGAALAELGRTEPRLVVLDADLAGDCGLRPFAEAFPDRFFENGISEQDMVSTAGGLALAGFVPVVSSFGAFLAARANEQIYVNASEGTKVIYACHYAGLTPAGAGLTHQGVRETALLGHVPGLVVLHPGSPAAAARLLRWCVREAAGPCALRLPLGRQPAVEVPDEDPAPGRGALLRPGAEALLLTYGPSLLSEALQAAESLARRGRSAGVVDMPWLNLVDGGWLRDLAGDRAVLVVEEHYGAGGLADRVLAALHESGSPARVRRVALDTWPAWGTRREVLGRHGLLADRLAGRVEAALEEAARAG
jgi:transketolase